LVKDEVEHAARANMKIRVLEKFMLHVSFIEFTVDLGSGTLYMAGHEVKRKTSEPKKNNHTQTAAPFERFRT